MLRTLGAPTSPPTCCPSTDVVKLLVTGGAGFIGSNYVRHVLAHTDDEVTVYDALTYAGNLSTMRDVDDDPRYKFVKGNICDPDDRSVKIAALNALVLLAPPLPAVPG